MHISYEKIKNYTIISCQPTQMEKVASLFDDAHPTGVKKENKLPGRGQIRFIKTSDHVLILRHYVRGGFIKQLLHDRYFYFLRKLTRPWRELHLLAYLHERNFAVPEPVASRIYRQGLFYTADILMKEIPQAQPLSTYLQSTKLAEEHWQQIGKVIKKFHTAGVFHADLNAHNILIDARYKVWLVDFDRGKILKPAQYWQLANLKRLRRSLLKLSQKNDIYFTPRDWNLLMQGYEVVE